MEGYIVVSYILAVWMITLTRCTGEDAYMPINRRGVGNCAPLTITDLGTVDTLSYTGIVSKAFKYSVLPPPEVQILDYYIVCESAGSIKGTVSSFSAIVMFRCLGQGCGGASNQSVVLIQQFQADCNLPIGNLSSSFEYPRIYSRSYIRNEHPLGNFSTPVNKQCGQCLDPSGTRRHVDPFTHCAGCTGCNEGQRRCVGTSSIYQCCNWYLNNICSINTCPSPLVGNNITFDCGCREQHLLNGSVSYSNPVLIVGSIATHTCDDAHGYVLSNQTSINRICLTTGWSGIDVTCELFDCGLSNISSPENGLFSYEDTTFGSRVVYSCDDNFRLEGIETRTCSLDGWSGDNPTCVQVD